MNDLFPCFERAGWETAGPWRVRVRFIWSDRGCRGYGANGHPLSSGATSLLRDVKQDDGREQPATLLPVWGSIISKTKSRVLKGLVSCFGGNIHRLISLLLCAWYWLWLFCSWCSYPLILNTRKSHFILLMPAWNEPFTDTEVSLQKMRGLWRSCDQNGTDAKLSFALPCNARKLQLSSYPKIYSAASDMAVSYFRCSPLMTGHHEHVSHSHDKTTP